MKKLYPITVLAFAAAAFLTTGAYADTKGTCNAIVASGLGSAQACADMSCEPNQCIDVANAFAEFVATEGCLEAFDNGELNGLPGNASVQPAGPDEGGAKNIQFVICGALDTCGLCPAALALGICPTLCID